MNSMIKVRNEWRYNPERAPDLNALDWRWRHPFIRKGKGKRCAGCKMPKHDSVHTYDPNSFDADKLLKSLRPRPTKDEIIAFLESKLSTKKRSMRLKTLRLERNDEHCFFQLCDGKSSLSNNITVKLADEIDFRIKAFEKGKS